MRRLALLALLALLPAGVQGTTPSERANRQFAVPPTPPEAPSDPKLPPRRLQVGPDRPFKLPSEAAREARHGDTVEIDAGVYVGDVAIWPQHRLTLRGVGGQPLLKANGQAAQGKAIWVIRGVDVRVENIAFAETRVPDMNGAGIRHEGGNLTVVGCLFRDNEDGILSGSNPEAEISIERSEFARNGHRSGYAHGIYFGAAKRLTVTGSYFHGSPIGHLLKSRARTTIIAYNRIMDEAKGTASYQIDLPDGGLGVVMGNLIQQGPYGENAGIVAYMMEHHRPDRDNRLFVVNNTIVNQKNEAFFVQSRGGDVLMANNILVGAGVALWGGGTLVNNLLVPLAGEAPRVDGGFDRPPHRGNRSAADAGLADLAGYQYRLVPGSPAIGNAIDPAGVLAAVDAHLAWEYVHPHGLQPRRQGPPFDIGAYAAPAGR